MSVKIAIVGDIHSSWTERDTDYFNQSNYDMILFVGDLPGHYHRDLLKIASQLSKIQLPSLLIPGNHDGVSTRQLISELFHNRKMIEKYSSRQEKLCTALKKTLSPITMAGYSLHSYKFNNLSFDVIGCRPHSAGGAELAYYPYLERKYHVSSMGNSFKRLKDLIDQSKEEKLIFLAHNGPLGLGQKRDDIWGRDFHPKEGDFGDLDLQNAVDYARIQGKHVIAVVAGHMHHRLKGGGYRNWIQQEKETIMINAARVPRIFQEKGTWFHHHISMKISDSKQLARINEILVDESLREIESRQGAI